MNAEDTARLEELAIHVYALYVAKVLTKGEDEDEDKNGELISEYQIEYKRNRVGKAMRMLLEANIINRVKKIDGDVFYSVVNIEKARQYEQKPTHTIHWLGLTDEVCRPNNQCQCLLLDYKVIGDFNELEMIYVFFHLNEFHIIKSKNGVSNYYLKECIERRNKFVLRNMVELEFKYNFPRYINLFAEIEGKILSGIVEEKFEFDKYCISTIFEKNELNDVFKVYTQHYERITRLKRALDKTLLWVEKVGGFNEAIKVIRKQIIEDLKKGYVRYTISLKNADDENADDNKNDLIPGVPYIEKVKHLLTYETLYLDPIMSGEDIVNVNTTNGGWSSRNILCLDMEGEFDEERAEGDANQTDQAA